MKEIIAIIWEGFTENIYEICASIGLFLTVIFNKNKTPEQINKSNQKLLAKYEKEQNKDMNKIKNRAKKIDALRGQINNASSSQ